MAGFEEVRFEDLTEIGDTPLAVVDLESIMRWAITRGVQLKALKQELREAGDDLDEIWEKEPDVFIGDLDDPMLADDIPAHAYGAATVFGLKTAQLSAYNRAYDKTTDGLNADLFLHFRQHNVEVDVGSQLGDDRSFSPAGIFELHHNGQAWGRRVEEATGQVNGVDVKTASLWLESGDGENHGVRLLELHPPYESGPLDVSLRYPT